MCAEGGGKADATDKATGVPEGSLSTLPQNPVATARPGPMETPHSAQTSQHTGKSPVMYTSVAHTHKKFPTKLSLPPVLREHIKNPGGALDSGRQRAN